MPSLLEVLQDPNYTGANQATKEAIFNKYAPQDPLYADANPATQEAIRAKYGFGGVKKEEEKPIVQQKKPEDVGYLEGSLESLKRGLGGYEESGAGISLAASSVLGNEEAARKKMEAIKAENKKVEEKPGLSVADLERIYEEKGLASAAGQVPKYISQQLLQSAPEMAGPLAAGAVATPFLSPVGGALVGIGTYGIQQFGHFLARQAEEKQDPKELEVTKAALVAAGTAPLGYFADRFTAGLGGMAEKKAGQEILKELSARQIAAQVGKRAAVGAGVGIIAEAPLEVLEQAAERYQAGLSLTGEDAYKEYKEAFFGAAAAGGSIGAASRSIKGYAQAKVENIQAREEAQSTGKNTFDEGAEYESTGADTGVSKQGVLAFNEQEVGTDQTAGGTGELNASGLDTTNTSTEGTAGGESVQQRALIEKEQFNNWLKEHDIIPTSEKEINMYEDMWRREQNLTGATTVDKGQAAKREVTEEEQNLIKVIRSGENWLRENPDDAHYQEAVNVVNRNRAALKALQETQQTTPEPKVLASKGVSKQGGFDFNAPDQTTPDQTTPDQTTPTPPKVSFKQEGFDFGTADTNTQREIIDETPSKGFELSAPSGQVLKGNGIEIIDGPPIAKLDLATENIDSVEAFINSIKPDTQTEQQLQNIDVDKKSILKTIKEFLGLPITYKPQLTEEEKAQGITEKPLAIERGAELDEDTFNRRLGVINTFFNTLSLAPQERQQRLQDLRKALPGLNVQQQKQAFAEFFNIKNLNSARGIKELRSSLEEWLDKYEGALLGEGKGNAVLGEGRYGIGWRKGQYVVRTGDKINFGPVMKAALDRLKSKHPDQRTPEEKAAYIFFSRKSPYEQPFVFALRNAAYLLNKSKINKKGELIKQGPVYKGETKENAVLFRKWLKENAPDKILDYFDATAQDFRTQFEKAEKISEQMRKNKAATKEGVSGRYMPWLYREPTGKTQGLQPGAGLTKYMKESKGTVINPEDFVELGVNIDLIGKRGQVLRPDLLNPDAFAPLHPAVESCIANNDLNGALKIIATSADAYTRGVAEKFLSLGLKTATVFDKQDTISIDYINWAYSSENSSRAKVFNFLKDTVPNLETNVIKIPTTIAEMQEQLSMLENLQNYDLITPIKLDLEAVIKSYSNVLDVYFTAKGAYYSGIDTINLNRNLVISNNDFIHEVAHAASVYALAPSNFEKLTPKQQKAVSELKKLFEIAKNSIEGQNILDTYGLTDIDEFVAEAFSNVEFQRLLKRIPYKRYFDPTKMNAKNAPLFKGAENRDAVLSPKAQKQTTLETIKTLAEKLYKDNYFKQDNNLLWDASLKLKTKIIPSIDFKEMQIAELKNDLIPNSISLEQKAKRERVLAAFEKELADLYAQATNVLEPIGFSPKAQKQTQKDLFGEEFDITKEQEVRTLQEDNELAIARAERRAAQQRKKAGIKEYEVDTSAFSEFVYVDNKFNVDNYLDLFYNDDIPREGAPGYYDKIRFPENKKEDFEYAYNQAKDRGQSSFKFPVNKKEFVTFPILDKPVSPPAENLWDKFTNLISRLIGLDNVLGHTLANANIILQATPAVDYASDVQNALVYASKGKPNTMALNGTRQTAPPRQGFVDRIFSGRPTWEAMKTSMPFWLESLDDSLRKHYLGAFTLRQLDDMVGRRLPPFTEFIQNVENMLDARNSVLTETKKVIKPWQKFQEKHPELAKTLNLLMIDATVETIDPSKFTATNYYGMGSLDAFNALSDNDKNKRRALDKSYKDIGVDGQNIYNKVKDFYADRLAAYKESLLARVSEVIKAELITPEKQNITEEEIKAHPSYKKIDEYFKRHTLEPYFPLKRFGDYWLVVNKSKGQAKEFYQFESALERNAFAKKRKEEIGKDVEIDMGNSLRDAKWKSSIKDLEFLKELKDLVRTGKGDDVKTLKGNLEEALENLYLLQLPDQNVRKMFLPRKNTAGMDQDMLRAFSSSAFHMAYQHSRFTFGPKLFTSVKQSEDYLTGMGNPAEEKKLRDYINELSKRVDFIMNPPDTGKLPSFLSNVSFIWYMTAPASALVNMLGVVAVGQPVLATRFGQAQTAKTMIGYAKRVGKSGFKAKDENGNETWAFPSIARDPNLTDVQKKAIERFTADGLFDITLSHDIVGLAESSSNLYTGRSQKVMGVLSGLFHGAEKFNREVVAMSAFDMAMEKYAKPENGGYKGDKLFKKAVEVTKDLTYKSMFDYSTLNKPRFFQGKWAKVALQFKQFSQQMSYLIGRSGLEGFSKMYNYDVLIAKEKQLGPNQQLPELEEVRQQINAIQRDNGEPEYQGAALEAQLKKYYDELRREGRDRLYGTLGMTFAFAGTTGLPGWWALSKLAEALEAVFCDDADDEKPFDFNNWYKNWLSDNFGGFWGDSISRGIMSQVSGVNLADRMGLNDLWFRDPRASKDETDALQNMLIGLMGPSVGLMVSATDAMKQMREGHLERAMETMSPAILKDILKAGRFSETFGEGKATTLKGDVLIDDFGVGEVAAQALGFSSERLAQRQKANIEMKTAEQEILTKRQALLNAFFMSIDNSDDDLRERTIEKIIKFNSSNPGASITGSNLSRSVLNRYRQRSLAQITGGMNIQKKLIGELGGMAAYGDE